jgi:hypothetical protein
LAYWDFRSGAAPHLWALRKIPEGHYEGAQREPERTAKEVLKSMKGVDWKCWKDKRPRKQIYLLDRQGKNQMDIPRENGCRHRLPIVEADPVLSLRYAVFIVEAHFLLSSRCIFFYRFRGAVHGQDPAFLV